MTNREAKLHRLVQASGLAGIIVEFQARGFAFHWYSDEQSKTVPPDGKIAISIDQVISMGLPEVDAFTTVVAHELGHVRAYELGLDHADEDVAWAMAEQLCPKPLPAAWDQAKAISVASYRWPKRASELPKEAAQAFADTFSCISCGAGPSTQRSVEERYDRIIVDRIVACTVCKEQVRVRYRNELATRMWQLDVEDYHPVLIQAVAGIG